MFVGIQGKEKLCGKHQIISKSRRQETGQSLKEINRNGTYGKGHLGK